MEPLRIGTRKSPLALTQAQMVADALKRHTPDRSIELVKIETSGDQLLQQNLYEIGGKGLFLKEIEEALLDGRIDMAVHSMKDVPGQLDERFTIAAMLEREDPRDAFISSHFKALHSIEETAVIGTSSPRRMAQVLALKPNVKVVPFRGNVQTRLVKLAQGKAEGTLLAMAGLKRLGLEGREDVHPVSVTDMLPAVAQGVIGVEVLRENVACSEILQPLNHRDTVSCILCERAFLGAFDGSCKTPIAGYAVLDQERLEFRGLVASFDGIRVEEVAMAGMREEAEAIGARAAESILSRIGDNFFDVA